MQLANDPTVALSGIVSSQTEQDDTQLVKASRDGEQDAFALLVQRHQRRVFNLVLRMVQGYEDANEVTQEAFVAAWQGLPSFRGEARFATWLYRIAYRCCLRQLERHQRERDLQAVIEAEQTREGMHRQQRVEDILERRDQQTVVREQMEQLPANYPWC